MERHYHIGQEASSGTFHERYDMIPPTLILITPPLFVSSISRLSSLFLISVSLRFVPHTAFGICFISNESGSLL